MSVSSCEKSQSGIISDFSQDDTDIFSPSSFHNLDFLLNFYIHLSVTHQPGRTNYVILFVLNTFFSDSIRAAAHEWTKPTLRL